MAYAANMLRKGGVGAIPTETVYGLAADATREEAVARVFQVKNRPHFDPLILHLADLEAVSRWALDIPPPLEKLARAFWPGPLTLLLPKAPAIPEMTTAGLPRAAFRVPAHPVAQALLRQIDFPLAAPSANPFGYVSPTTAQHVAAQLGGLVGMILDGGPCEVGLESTIVGLEAGEQLTIHRLGGLSQEAIEEVAGPAQLALNRSSDPAAPGQLKKHYAPGKPLQLGNIEAMLTETNARRIALIRFQEPLALSDARILRQEVLTPKADMKEAACRLFALLRELDADPEIEEVLAEPVPEVGLGRAINDRLRRAAAF